MTRLLTAFFLLTAMVEPRQSQDRSADILIADAVAKSKADHATIASFDQRRSKRELNGDGTLKKPMESPAMKDSGNEFDQTAVSITPDVLFREGRYRYFIKELISIDSNPIIVIGFSPKGGAQPKPDSESASAKILNQVINNLEGQVFIDQATNGIMRIEAKLATEIQPYIVGRIYKAEFTFQQEALGVDGPWVPDQLTTTMRYSKNMGITKPFNQYTVSFSNFKFKPPSN